MKLQNRQLRVNMKSDGVALFQRGTSPEVIETQPSGVLGWFSYFKGSSTIWRLFCLLTITTLVSCATLLKANFEGDTPGRPPGSSPPGEPVGDMIWVVSTESAGVPDAAVVIGDGIEGNSLSYSNLDIPSLFREVRFFSKERDLNSDAYWATWNGRINQFTDATSPFDISFGNLEIGAGWLRIHDGEFLVRSRAGSWEFEPIGPYSERGIHTIVFKIDKTNSTYSIWVLQHGQQDLSVESIPLSNPGLLEERRLIINMRFSGEGHSDGIYVMDNVLISEREPERM